jgi:hypothetical protein
VVQDGVQSCLLATGVHACVLAHVADVVQAMLQKPPG